MKNWIARRISPHGRTNVIEYAFLTMFVLMIVGLGQAAASSGVSRGLAEIAASVGLAGR